MRPIRLGKVKYYLSTNVTVTVIHRIVLQVILWEVDDTVGILALELLFTSSRLSVAKN